MTTLSTNARADEEMFIVRDFLESSLVPDSIKEPIDNFASWIRENAGCNIYDLQLATVLSVQIEGEASTSFICEYFKISNIVFEYWGMHFSFGYTYLKGEHLLTGLLENAFAVQLRIDDDVRILSVLRADVGRLFDLPLLNGLPVIDTVREYFNEIQVSGEWDFDRRELRCFNVHVGHLSEKLKNLCLDEMRKVVPEIGYLVEAFFEYGNLHDIFDVINMKNISNIMDNAKVEIIHEILGPYGIDIDIKNLPEYDQTSMLAFLSYILEEGLPVEDTKKRMKNFAIEIKNNPQDLMIGPALLLLRPYDQFVYFLLVIKVQHLDKYQNAINLFQHYYQEFLKLKRAMTVCFEFMEGNIQPCEYLWNLGDVASNLKFLQDKGEQKLLSKMTIHLKIDPVEESDKGSFKLQFGLYAGISYPSFQRLLKEQENKRLEDSDRQMIENE